MALGSYRRCGVASANCCTTTLRCHSVSAVAEKQVIRLGSCAAAQVVYVVINTVLHIAKD